jgi:hypothetical protein
VVGATREALAMIGVESGCLPWASVGSNREKPDT